MQAAQYIKEDRNNMYAPIEQRMSAKDPFSSLMSIDLWSQSYVI